MDLTIHGYGMEVSELHLLVGDNLGAGTDGAGIVGDITMAMVISGVMDNG
jgi:hypothetical protein